MKKQTKQKTLRKIVLRKDRKSNMNKDEKGLHDNFMSKEERDCKKMWNESPKEKMKLGNRI